MKTSFKMAPPTAITINQEEEEEESFTNSEKENARK